VRNALSPVRYPTNVASAIKEAIEKLDRYKKEASVTTWKKVDECVF
jgi:hypothetical protein